MIISVSQGLVQAPLSVQGFMGTDVHVSKIMGVLGSPWIADERDPQVLSEGNFGRHGTSVILQREKF